jgi:hypothetical protein
VNIFDEQIENHPGSAESQHQFDLIIKRALQEKLTDLTYVLTGSNVLHDHGVRCERIEDAVVLSSADSELARWSCDGMMLRLTWAGPDLTALSTKDAVRLTAHLLVDKLAVVKRSPAVVVPATVVHRDTSRGLLFAPSLARS